MAWTSATCSLDRTFDMSDDIKRFRFKFEGTSDAGNGATGDLTLSTMLETAHGSSKKDLIMQQLAGGSLFSVHYVKNATVATTNPLLTIDDADGCLLFSYTYTAATSEAVAGAEEKGYYPPVTDLIIACGAIGASKKLTFYIWVEK